MQTTVPQPPVIIMFIISSSWSELSLDIILQVPTTFHFSGDRYEIYVLHRNWDITAFPSEFKTSCEILNPLMLLISLYS